MPPKRRKRPAAAEEPEEQASKSVSIGSPLAAVNL